MLKHLYPRFLSDAQEYRRAELLWESIWEQVLPRGTAADWLLWLNTSYSNGTAFMDGNPIFSRISRRQRRAVRIIQSDPTVNSLVLDVWSDRLPADAGSTAGIDELVISCELSDEAAALVTEILSSWLSDGQIIVNTEFAGNEYGDAGAERWEPANEFAVA